MSLNIESIILDFLSPIEPIRKKSESLLTSYFNSMLITELSKFYSILRTSQNDNVKLYTSIFIKNFIEQKITSENRNELIEYINTYKYDIFNIILNSNLEKKTINLLILSLCEGLSYFQIDMINYNKTVYELCSYIFQFYNQQKNNNFLNDNISISKTLFVCSKFIKYIDKDMNKIMYENVYNLDKDDNNELNKNNTEENNFEKLNLKFYNVIVDDYNNLYKIIIDNGNKSSMNNQQIYEYIILYLKIFKYSLIYLERNSREKILEINYNLIIYFFNKLLNNNTSINTDSSLLFIIKYFSDIILLSNKIIIKYLSTHIIKITLNTIKNYSSFFYSFISDENLFSTIEKIFNTEKNKFIIDIIQFFYKLIDLVYITFPEYSRLCDENNKNNFKEISEYINQILFTKDNIKFLLFFVIKKCFIFNENEIFLAQENCENFYLCFTEYSSLYDIKNISGNLCNLIYTIFKKKYNDIFKFLENNLISLTLKENQNSNLTGDELNIKCAFLIFFIT